MTAEEVARKLRVDRRVVSDWCKKGDMPAIKPGKHWLIDKTDFREWVRRMKVRRPRWHVSESAKRESETNG